MNTASLIPNPMTGLIKAVLFDMDGTLIEAKDWHFEAFNRALELFGMPISRIDHETTFDGLPTSRKLEMLTIERGLPKELHGFLNEMKQRHTVEMIHTQCRPAFSQEQALSTLKARGYRLAVCSNSIKPTIDLMMEKAELMKYLEFTVSNQCVAKSKPAPDMYLLAMERMGLQPHECLIVEDNENGIKAARASGGHLLVVHDVADTNITNITNRIREIEAAATGDARRAA